MNESEIILGMNAQGQEGEETAEIYRREARESFGHDRERAASFLLDAAYANEHDEAQEASVVRDLRLSAALAPEAEWCSTCCARLYLQLGMYREALSLFSRAYENTQNADVKLAVSLTCADLLWIALDDIAGAQAYVEKALALDETHVGALYAGLWMSLSPGGARGDGESFALRVAKILGAPSERSALYALAGRLALEGGNEVGAHEYFSLSTQADRGNVYGWIQYAILCERYERYAEAAHAYAEVSQILCDRELGGIFSQRAAVTYGFLGQHEREGYYYGESIEKGGDKFFSVWMAIDANRALGNDQRVSALLRQLIEMSADDLTRASHMRALSDVCVGGLGMQDEGVSLLEQASKLGASAADARLAALYDLRGETSNLAQVFERLGEADALAKPCYLWLQGKAYRRGGAYREAISAFEKCGGSFGFFGLDFCYEAVKDDTAHARMLERWIHATQDAPMGMALLSQLTMLLSDRLASPGIAIQYLETLPKAPASHDLLWRRIHLLTQLEQYEALADALLALARDVSDEEEARGWRMEAAYVCDRDIGNVDRCVEILKNLHADCASYVPAIVYCHHIALREGRYGLLIETNGWREAFQMNAGGRRDMALENAWANLQRKDDRAALAWFEKARKFGRMSPYDADLYISLLRRLECWEELSDFLSEMCGGESSSNSGVCEQAQGASKSAVDALVGAGENAENCEKYWKGFEQSLQYHAYESLRLDIGTFCLRRGRENVRLRRRLFEESATVYRTVYYLLESLVWEPPENALEIIRKARDLFSEDEILALLDWIEAETIHRGGNHSEQISAREATLYQRSLSLPYGVFLRANILSALRMMPHDDVTSWLERYAEQTSDKWMQNALCREAALRALWREHDPDRARKALSRFLIREDGNRRTLWMLEQFSALSEDWQALGYFREKLAQLEMGTRARLEILKSALLPYIDDEQPAHAVRVAQECLKLDAHAFPALVTLSCVAEENDDFYQLACVADRLAQASSQVDNRVSYGLWAAQLWSVTLHDPEAAVRSLACILAQDAGCLPAISMCVPLLMQLGQYEQLGRIYAQAISAVTDDGVRMDLLHKHAELLSEQLHDIAGATLELSRILQITPDDKAALSMQARLLVAQNRWSEAVEVMEHLSKVEDDPENKRATTLELSRILIHQLSQQDRAKRILKKHLNLFLHDMQALVLLYDIACAERHWTEAKAALEEICQSDPSPEALRHARISFTKIAREAGWSHDLRTLYEREALNAVIGYREDFNSLVDDYREHHEIPRLIEVARREMSRQGDAEMLAQYRGCVAALLVSNAQHREALVFLSEIIQESQNTDWAYLARAQALANAGQLDSSIGEFRRALRRNIALQDAFEPFIQVLKQKNEPVSLAAVTAVRNSRMQTLEPPWQRCVSGTVRGFLDFDQIGLPRSFIEAQRYLRMVVPNAYALFNDGLSGQKIPENHWAYARCQQLFGQNFEIRAILSHKRLHDVRSRLKLDLDAALVFDAALLESPSVEFDYWAAYAMHQAVTGGSLVDLLDDAHVDALFLALCQPKPENPLAQTMKKNLFKLLPRSDRRIFKDGVPFMAPNWQAFRNALQTRAAITGAIMCASPACALACRPNDPDLENFLISENYPRFVNMFWGAE